MGIGMSYFTDIIYTATRQQGADSDVNTASLEELKSLQEKGATGIDLIKQTCPMSAYTAIPDYYAKALDMMIKNFDTFNFNGNTGIEEIEISAFTTDHGSIIASVFQS
jgi:hypothetical protein